jgi:hypothetical protein
MKKCIYSRNPFCEFSVNIKRGLNNDFGSEVLNAKL